MSGALGDLSESPYGYLLATITGRERRVFEVGVFVGVRVASILRRRLTLCWRGVVALEQQESVAPVERDTPLCKQLLFAWLLSGLRRPVARLLRFVHV
jgi:hypothetical protein